MLVKRGEGDFSRIYRPCRISEVVGNERVKKIIANAFETKKIPHTYSEPELLKDILERILKGRKFRLECGHHVSFGSNLGNDITVINGKVFKIICSLCGH